MKPNHRGDADGDSEHIDFESFAKPIFREGCCFFPGELRGTSIQAGVTEEVLLALWGRRPEDGFPRTMDLFHPAFGRAKELIEAKLNRYGLNAGGRLIVTMRDLSLDRGHAD
jgi:hypothetical protein